MFVNVKIRISLNLIGFFIYREVVSAMGNSLTEIRRSTLEMLRTTVQLTQSLPVLPDKCGISMKLLYYEDGKII